MNKIGPNILLILLLSGCAALKNSRTDSKGETINKNAPVFISPKTNEIIVNKANTNAITPNKTAQVVFNAENYVMVKEKDLNILIDQKTNENLLNIKKSNANAPQPNKELDEAIDSHIIRKKLGDSEQGSSTANVMQLTPVALEKALSNSPAIHPFLAFIMTILIISTFILAVGYFFFIKKKAPHENSTVTTAPTAAPTPTEVATETAAAEETSAETASKN